MIPRRAGVVLPAALALIVASLSSASAVVAPYSPVDPAEPLVVAELGEATLFGVEVSARSITWGVFTGDLRVVEPGVEPEPETPTAGLARQYQPDLGKSPLTLGASVTPPIEHALNQASTAEWSVGFDPFNPAVGLGAAMTVRHQGGPESVIELSGDVAPWDGDIFLWGDTAVLGQNVVNLNTREAFDLDHPCILERPVLADGLLLLRDRCEGAVVAVEVPADGITADDLDGAWTTVLDEVPQFMAYSQGLLVFGSEAEGFSEIGYRRLDADAGLAPETWRRAVDGHLVAVRVQGHRFVAVTTDESPEATALVFAEGQPVDAEPLAEVGVGGVDYRKSVVPDAEPMAAGALEGSVDPSSDMSLDTIPIDLYGRTLAWSTGTQIVAATLPALAGGAVTSTAPATGKAGAPVAVTAAGLLPGEEVAVWLESDPALLALGRAGADGTFAATVTLPAGAAAGTHTLTVHGVESGWSSARPITLAAPGNPGLRIDTGR